MHPALFKIAEAWKGTVFDRKAYLVGGAVRDQLLGIKSDTDLDIVLEHDAVAAANLLARSGVAQSEPVVFPRFGTAMVTVDGTTIELATARTESYDADSRKPDVQPASLFEDASRRDFTVNSLMRNVATGELLDLLGTGLNDLESRVLRTPVTAEDTFRDDPLRMLRAVRFKWQLGFRYAPDLSPAIHSQAKRLQVVSAERIKEEFVKMLQLSDADQCLVELMDFGLFDEFAPEFRQMVGCAQGDYHDLDVWHHSLLTLKNVGDRGLVTKLAGLFHDIGKPSTKSFDEEGKVRFFGHETVGSQITKTVLTRMKFDNSTIESVSLLVQNHMRLNSMVTITPSAARRIVRDLGSDLEHWFDLIEADSNALKKGVKQLDIATIKESINQALEETPLESLKSPLDGDEIQALLRIESGPQIGQLKALLLDDVLEGILKPFDHATARTRLMEHWCNLQQRRLVADKNTRTVNDGE